MTVGWNRWEGGGNVTSRIDFTSKPDGTPVGTFTMACDRWTRGGTVTAYVKINVYGKLAEVCQPRLAKGMFVRVEGELMNRSGQYGELMEVRARDVTFLSSPAEGDVDGS